MKASEAKKSDRFRRENGEWWYYPPSGVRGKAVTGTCELCGDDWVRANSGNKAYRFCSNECYRNWRRDKREVECEQCGSPFLRGEVSQRFCSHDCYAEWNQGENHWHFTDFGRDEYLRRRSEAKGKWSKTRTQALERDGFSCRACGSGGDGVILDVHHVKPILEGGTNELHNLLTLCRRCHKAVENKGGYDRGELEIRLGSGAQRVMSL